MVKSDSATAANVRTVLVENFSPDPEVYVAAAGALWNGTFTSHNKAIQECFSVLHPEQPKNYAGKYIAQFRIGFRHHSWWAGRSTPAKLKIKARALGIMAANCVTPNKPRPDTKIHYVN